MGKKAEHMKYILYGTDELSRQAAEFFGKENIGFFFDPSYDKDELLAVPVIKDEAVFKKHAEFCKTVLTWSDVKRIAIAVEVMTRSGIRYSMFGEAAADIIEAEAKEYDRLNTRKEFAYDEGRRWFFARDRVSQAGTVNHYFWQDLWCARHVFKLKPDLHYDIGSRVDGFISSLLAFGQKVNLIDVRPLDASIPGVGFTQADATNLDSIDDDSIYSLSALCSLEHFGLGRYGDPIDPEACFKCFEAIQRKVSVGGSIFIAVPVGLEGVEFNAHRIFRPKTVIEAFSKCELKEYSIDYGTHIEYDADLNKLNDSLKHEFGLFYFVRIR